MNIALHLRKEVVNYKDCIEACTCHPERWTYCNIDVCKNIKNKAVFVYYSEMWHLAQYLWTQTSVIPGRMTDSSPLYKEMEVHIICSSFVILRLGFPILFVGMFFPPFSLFFFANLHFNFLFCLILLYLFFLLLKVLLFLLQILLTIAILPFHLLVLLVRLLIIFLFRLSLFRFFFRSRHCFFVAPYHDTSCYSLLSFSSRLSYLSFYCHNL